MKRKPIQVLDIIRFPHGEPGFPLLVIGTSDNFLYCVSSTGSLRLEKDTAAVAHLVGHAPTDSYDYVRDTYPELFL